MAKKKNREITVAKINLQETRLFHYRYPYWEKVNEKLLPEIKQHYAEDPKGLPGTNHLCWRGNKKYKNQDKFIIGGPRILDQLFELVEEFYLTKIYGKFN